MIPWLEIGLVGLVVFAIWLAIHYAKRSSKEEARADSATETADVAAAMAEDVRPAGTLEQLKARAKKRRLLRAARRKRRGH